MEISVNTVAASIGAENGVKIATLECVYPRVLLAEVNTHRVFTRNGQSSRAVPFQKMLAALETNFHSPLQWLKNQPGMVATEVMSDEEAAECQAIWEEARQDAIHHAVRLAARHASKQYVNRLLEPFMMTRTLITSTRWANFLKLRDHEAATPEFQLLASLIGEKLRDAEYMERSVSEPCARWHMPYIEPQDLDTARIGVETGEFDDPEEIPCLPQLGLAHGGMRTLLMMSIARCCRLSYKTFDGENPTVAKDFATFAKLNSDPLHASPMEHVACTMPFPGAKPHLTGNFHGWLQLRKIMPNEAVEEALNLQ